MLRNNEWVNDLLAWYGILLTDKQRSIMQSYYQEDLSLAEIAENSGVSRAAVHDAIKRSEEILDNFESKLKMVEKFKSRSQQYEKLLELNNIEVNAIVKELEKIE